MLTSCSKFQIRNLRTFGFVYHDTNGQNHGPVLTTQLFFLNEICMVILWKDCYGKGNLRRSYWSTLGRRFPNWECFLTPWDRVILVFLCGWHQIGWKENLDPMWKVLNREVDLGEPTSFLDHVFLGCTQQQCEISKDIVDNYRTMLESGIFAGATEKVPCSENLYFVVLRFGR